MRDWIGKVKPGALLLIDATMTAYCNWEEARVGGAPDATLETLGQRIKSTRKELSDC